MRFAIIAIALNLVQPVFAAECTPSSGGWASGTVNGWLGNDQRDARLCNLEKRVDTLEGKADRLEKNQKEIEAGVNRLLEERNSTGH